MQQYKLAERAVLYRVSFGMPGTECQDDDVTAKVKDTEHLGQDSGKWVKKKFPKWALEPIAQICRKAKAYHNAVTLPFDSGIGILPAALIMDYGARMRQFRGEFENQIENHFKPRYPEMIQWAKLEHNGTFDESDYPAIEELCESFYFRTDVLPVPDAAHFEGTMSALLGVDAQGINVRVADAMQEAQRELMQRLIKPLKNMVAQLTKEKEEGKRAPALYKTLVSNVSDIAALAPKLNLAGDPAIDSFCKDMLGLTANPVETLKEDVKLRAETATKAADVLKRLEGYKI